MAAVLLWTSALHLRQTMLHVACREGNAALVELLISHGADVHAKERLFGCPSAPPL
jgi:ankyrin repeat protein